MLSKTVAAHALESRGQPSTMPLEVEGAPGTCGDNAAAAAGTGLSPKTPSLNEVSMAPELSSSTASGEAMSRAKFAFLAKATNNGSLGTAAVRQKPDSAELDLRDIVSEKRNGNRRFYRQTTSGTGELPPRPRGQRSASTTDAFNASMESVPDLLRNSTSQGTNASERLEREAVEAICKLAVANLALVHSLQAERGASAIYLASSTQVMSDKLQIYRQRTDSLLANLPQATIEGEELEPTDYGKALGNLRVTVDNRSIAYLEVLVSYSWIVDSLLDMLTQAIEPVRRTAVGPSVATLLLVQRIKECSGLQRGTVSGVLASGVLRVQWEVYWSLVKNLARMEAFEGVFRLLADSEVLDAFQEKASHMPPLLSEFQARLEDSKEMVEGMLITTNVEVWFRQSSEWIGLLDSIQNMVVESIQATAQRICQDEDLLLSLYQMDTSAESGSVRGAQQQQWGADKDDGGGDSSGDDKDGEEEHRNQYQNQPAGKKSTDVAKSPFRKQCSIAMEDLDLGEELGRGSTGPTYLAEWQGNKVAVKLFEKGPLLSDHRGHGYIRTFCREVQTLGQLHHPNICAFYGASISLPRCCIVTEHMDRGSLWSQLHGSGDTSIDFMATAAQIASGLGYLHDIAGLVHRDMKTPNILVDHSGKVKIADFGLTIMGSEVMDEGKRVGTLRWMAPEVMQREACSFSSDVYSLGIVLWELLTKDVPFRALDQTGSAIVRACNEGFRPVIPEGTPPSVANLIMSCIHPEPERRPEAVDVLRALQEARRQLSKEDLEFLNAPHFSDELVPYLSCWKKLDDPSQQVQPSESAGRAA